MTNNDRRFTIKCNDCGKHAFIDSSGDRLSDWVQGHLFECKGATEEK